jgi:hypothetical protein
MRRSALDTVDRWSEGLRIEDWDLFLRLAARDALGFIDVSVCAYRIHSTNLSKTRHGDPGHQPGRVEAGCDASGVSVRRTLQNLAQGAVALHRRQDFVPAEAVGALALHMLAYLSLMILSKIRFPSANHGAEAT